LRIFEQHFVHSELTAILRVRVNVTIESSIPEKTARWDSSALLGSTHDHADVSRGHAGETRDVSGASASGDISSGEPALSYSAVSRRCRLNERRLLGGLRLPALGGLLPAVPVRSTARLNLP
jgi:hypothetical protein